MTARRTIPFSTYFGCFFWLATLYELVKTTKFFILDMCFFRLRLVDNNPAGSLRYEAAKESVSREKTGMEEISMPVLVLTTN